MLAPAHRLKVTQVMQELQPRQIAPTSAQVPEVLDLIQRCFAFMESRIDPPSSMHRLSVEGVSEHCLRGEVWSIGTPPIACIFLKPKDPNLYISKLAVEPGMRGQGLARTLIQLAETRAIALALSGLELETRIELIENHETFRRLGFSKSGEGSHIGFDRTTYVTMHKTI